MSTGLTVNITGKLFSHLRVKQKKMGLSAALFNPDIYLAGSSLSLAAIALDRAIHRWPDTLTNDLRRADKMREKREAALGGRGFGL